MNYTTILLKKKCINYHNCTLLEDSKHLNMFYHACPFGKWCDKLDKVDHLNSFVHPCSKHPKCDNAETLHLAQFSHSHENGLEKRNSKELKTSVKGKFFYEFRNEKHKIQKPGKSMDLPMFVPLPFTDPKTWKKITMRRVNINGFTQLRKFMETISGPGKNGYGRLYDAISVYGKGKFYNYLLPYMIKLLKGTYTIFHKGKIEKIPFLKQNEKGTVKISREKVSYLLINAFFSTFTFYKHGAYKGNWDNNKFKLNVINFKRIFNLSKDAGKRVISKILFYMNYFTRLSRMNGIVQGNIVVMRNVIDLSKSKKELENCSFEFSKVVVKEKGAIEHDHSAKQIDFANMYIGGAVLGKGAVQEEIRFGINPECLISLLVCPCMLDNEAITIRGTEQFSQYKGYSRSLMFGGDYYDKHRSEYEICAIDALRFADVNPTLQFRNDLINREILKAYAGFSVGGNKNIATGNWGCGSFHGNLELKFIIQWIAASMCKKEISYYVYDKKKLSIGIKKFSGFVKANKVNVKMVYEALMKLEKVVKEHNLNVKKFSVMEVIMNILLEKTKDYL